MLQNCYKIYEQIFQQKNNIVNGTDKTQTDHKVILIAIIINSACNPYIWLAE